MADLIGVIPNQAAAVLDTRKKLCESLAVQFSAASTTADQRAIQRTMDVLVARNDDVLSMAMRTAGGKLVAASGDHSRWNNLSKTKSTPGQVQVPIYDGEDQWGSVEVKFGPVSPGGTLGLPVRPVFGMLCFVGVAGFFAYLFFIKKALKHLDPSAVIPGRVKHTLDVLAEGVILMDHNEQIVLANSTFAENVGQPGPSLLGRKASELNWIAPTSSEPGLWFPWLQSMRDGKTQRGRVLPLMSTSGSVRKFAVNGAPIRDGKGAVRGALATFDDVTEVEEKNDELQRTVQLLEKSRDDVEEKNRELATTNRLIETKVLQRTEELRASMEAAQAADRAKSAFLANISHELRTPMHGILSFAKFGERKIDQASKEKLLTYFQRIRGSGEGLMVLLNNLLDLSKAQAGRADYDMQPAQLALVVESVLDELSALSKDSQVQLAFTSPTFDTTGTFDTFRITQVVRNIVGNALKFSKPGGVVTVTVTDGTLDSHGRSVDALELSVADDGVGIPGEELENIFEPFTQSQRTDTGAGGTGLGLSICKEIVTDHGGRIQAINRPGGGAQVTFLIPKTCVTTPSFRLKAHG